MYTRHKSGNIWQGKDWGKLINKLRIGSIEKGNIIHKVCSLKLGEIARTQRQAFQIQQNNRRLSFINERNIWGYSFQVL